MTQVIDFFFEIIGDLWSLITTYWIISMSVLITVLSWVVDLVRGTRQD